MTQKNIKQLAKELKKAQKENFQIEAISDRFPTFSIDDSLKVLNEIHKLNLEEGHKPLGRKIGFTNPAMWEKFGVKEPVWAYMYDSTVKYANDIDELVCDISNLSQARIEPEIVISFCKSPKMDSSLKELLECIDWIAFGYEIVQCHYKDWKFKTPDIIADFALHAKLLIGEKIEVSKFENPIENLKNFELELYCNNKFLEKGFGYNVLSSPLEAIIYLLKVLKTQEFSKPLQKGEIITTGTITDAFLLKSGDIYKSKISGINLKDLNLKIK